jgi:hypothetical protein
VVLVDKVAALDLQVVAVTITVILAVLVVQVETQGAVETLEDLLSTMWTMAHANLEMVELGTPDLAEL